MNNDLTEMVREAIYKEMHWGHMAMLDNDTLLSNAGVDSLKAITILYGLEDSLDIEIEPEIVEQCQTVNDIVKQLQILLDKR